MSNVPDVGRWLGSSNRKRLRNSAADPIRPLEDVICDWGRNQWNWDAGDAVYTRVGLTVAVDIRLRPRSKVRSKQCDAPLRMRRTEVRS